MDPVSHCLLGRTVACLDRHNRLGRGRTAAAVLGAIAPDVDMLWAWRGWDVYLVHHEAGTHSLIWSPVVAAGVACVVRVFVHGASWMRLWLAAWIGVVIAHLALDLVSGSDMRVFAPLSSLRLGPHWFAMADLLLVATIVAGTVLSRWWRTAAAVLTLVVIVALCGVKWYSQREATQAVARAEAGSGIAWTIGTPEAVNGSIGRWRFYGQAGRARRGWQVDAWIGQVTTLFTRQSADPGLVPPAALQAPVVEHFGDLPGISLVTIEPAPRRLVLWSHLQDCSASACGMSFGVEVDAEGRLVRQVIRLGPWEMRRPLPSGTQPADGPPPGRRP